MTDRPAPDEVATTTDPAELPAPGDTQDAAATQSTETGGEDTDADEVVDDQPADDIGKARKQAAKYRTALREVESERDTLRDKLTAQQRAIVDHRAATAQRGAVAPELLDAAGLDITELLDDNGNLDMDAVDEFIETTAHRFRVQRRMKPDPAQGRSGDMMLGKPSLASAFAPKP